MISVAEATRRILDAMRPTATETVGLSSGWGRVLAGPVGARLDQPPADVSAMDGYALRAGDAGPWTVIGHAPAGHPFEGVVGPNEAVRLFTGSIIPRGADAIAIQEDVDRQGDRITLREAPQSGRHIRPHGGDFARGDLLLSPGTRLTARAIGLAAAANHPWLTVFRRPRIAILATGDEIALPGDPVRPGGIVSSNAHALAALVTAAGAEPVVLPIAADDLASVAATADQVGGVDLLATTGGASVGEHDLVQQGLAERGFVADFWKIAMRPGKPLIFGHLGNVPVLGLPGNPVSALVCGILFLVPAIKRMAGERDTRLPVSRGTLTVPLGANDQRADYLRAALAVGASGELLVTPAPRQDSSHLQVLARSDALALRPPHAAPAAAGDEIDLIRLDQGLF
ncbi:MAG: molybdopterin molybdotransferase MoeA [Acetobacteraceae bacterium]|nr:molybdopterin molybdotransferase MoeA [Acetobacteraceae bacterium]